MNLGHPALTVLGGLLGAALVGACSAGSAPTPAAAGSTPAPGQAAPVGAQATAVDPCALVTRADADAAFGFSFDPATVETSGGSKSCTYVHVATARSRSTGPSRSSREQSSSWWAPERVPRSSATNGSVIWPKPPPGGSDRMVRADLRAPAALARFLVAAPSGAARQGHRQPR